MTHFNWIFLLRGANSIISNEIFFNSLTQFSDLSSFENLILVCNQNSECYVPEYELSRIEVLGDSLLSVEALRKIRKEIFNKTRLCENLCLANKNIIYSKLNNVDLLNNFKKSIDCVTNMFVYFYISDMNLLKSLETETKTKLSNFFPKENVEEIYRNSTSSLLGETSIADASQASIQDNIAQMSKKQASVMQAINQDATLIEQIEFLKEQRFLSENREARMTQMNDELERLFSEISRRIGISLDDYLKSYSIEDTEAFLDHGFKLSSDEMQARKRSYVYLQDGSERHFFVGSAAEELANSILSY